MKVFAGIIIGLVIGVLLGGTGAYLFSLKVFEAKTDRIMEQYASIADLRDRDYAALESECRTLGEEKAVTEEKLAMKDDELKMRIMEIKKDNDDLRADNNKKKTQLAALTKRFEDLKNVAAVPEKPEPEIDKEAKAIAEVIARMKKIVPIGGPLAETAIKDLGLDEEQTASVNAALKDESERMLGHLRRIAADIIPNKDEGDFEDMNGLQIGVALMGHIESELEILKKLPEDDRTAMMRGEKHFVEFLPKDSHLVKIAKVFYEERKETYSVTSGIMDEEAHDKFKNVYLQSGMFIFPSGASFGNGVLTDDMFKE